MLTDCMFITNCRILSKQTPSQAGLPNLHSAPYLFVGLFLFVARIAINLLHSHFNIHTCRNRQIHQIIYGFWFWVQNIYQSLVHAHLVLVARIFIHKRRLHNGELIFYGRQRNRTVYRSSRSLSRFYYFTARLVDYLMVVGANFYSYTIFGHFLAFIFFCCIVFGHVL